MKKYKWNKEKFFANIGKLTIGLLLYGSIEFISYKIIIYILTNCMTTL